MAVKIEGPRYKHQVQQTYDHSDDNKHLQQMFRLEGEVGQCDAEAGGARPPSGHTSPAHGESEVKYTNCPSSTVPSWCHANFHTS